MRSRSVPMRCTALLSTVSLLTGNTKRAGNDGRAAHQETEEEKLSWLRQILEWQRDMSDNKEFMSLLKSDLDLFSDSGLLLHTDR